MEAGFGGEGFEGKYGKDKGDEVSVRSVTSKGH